MNARPWTFGVLISLPLLLIGCAAAGYNNGHVLPIPNASPKMSMAPGQKMPGTLLTAVTSPAVSIVKANGPSKSAQMICGSETRNNVASLMGLAVSPPVQSNWSDQIYTCTFKLTVGPFVISVKELANKSRARIYFHALRLRLGHTEALTGMTNLGFPAYETTRGTVVFLKDNNILEVNASALPAHVGPEGSSPADFAYTIATDILACWSGK